MKDQTLYIVPYAYFIGDDNKVQDIRLCLQQGATPEEAIINLRHEIHSAEETEMIWLDPSLKSEDSPLDLNYPRMELVWGDPEEVGYVIGLPIDLELQVTLKTPYFIAGNLRSLNA